MTVEELVNKINNIDTSQDDWKYDVEEFIKNSEIVKYNQGYIQAKIDIESEVLLNNQELLEEVINFEKIKVKTIKKINEYANKIIDLSNEIVLNDEWDG